MRITAYYREDIDVDDYIDYCTPSFQIHLNEDVLSLPLPYITHPLYRSSPRLWPVKNFSDGLQYISRGQVVDVCECSHEMAHFFVLTLQEATL